MDMGEPFGKASGRTFSARSTNVPDPCCNSLWVISSNSLNLSMRPPSEALKGGLPMSVFGNCGVYQSTGYCAVQKRLPSIPCHPEELEGKEEAACGDNDENSRFRDGHCPYVRYPPCDTFPDVGNSKNDHGGAGQPADDP